MAVATSTLVALGLAAAAAGGQYVNTRNTARRQDSEAAAGIRAQSARQREADSTVSDLIDKQAGSSGADEQANVLGQYMQQLRQAKAGSTTGLSQIGNVSDTARAAEADAALGVSDYGSKIASLMSAIDAPGLQRQNEAVDRARGGVALEGIGRNADGDAFLNELRLQGVRRNPWLDAFSSFASGASSGMAGGAGGGGGKLTKGTGGVSKVKTGTNYRGGY